MSAVNSNALVFFCGQNKAKLAGCCWKSEAYFLRHSDRGIFVGNHRTS